MLGKRIKGLRLKNGYTVTEFAKLADVSKSYLSQIERGHQKNPSLQFLTKIAKGLEISIDYLLEGETEKSKELDAEWKEIVLMAIKEGMKKEDFLEYRNYIQYENWKKEYKKNPRSK